MARRRCAAISASTGFEPFLAVHQEDHQVGLLHRQLHLPADGRVHRARSSRAAGRRCPPARTAGRPTRPSPKWRSRVVPGRSDTMAARPPTIRLNSVDLPTFGRPTIATVGMLTRPPAPASASVKWWEKRSSASAAAPAARRALTSSMKSPSSLTLSRRQQRQVEVVPAAEGGAERRAGQQARRRDPGAEEGVLEHDAARTSRPVASASGASTCGISAPIEVPVSTADAPARAGRASAPASSPDARLEVAHRADAVLHLRRSRRTPRARRQRQPGAQVQLVGAVGPGHAPLRPRPRRASARPARPPPRTRRRVGSRTRSCLLNS